MKKTKILFLTVLLNLTLFAGERIVTLSPSLNEIVFALGSGDEIVANTLYSNYPEESKKIPKLGGYSSISLEKILLSKPTIIFAQDYDETLLANLKKLHLNYHSFKTDNLSSIKNTITSIGKILKKEKRAKELVSNIDKELEQVKGIVQNKKIMIVITPRLDLSSSIYISGNRLYFNDIINYSGNKNAYQSESKSQPVVNVEKIIKMNPDVIILLAPFMHEQGLTKEQLKEIWYKVPISASLYKNIYVIDKDYSGIPSDRVVYFIEDFKKILENVKNR